MLLWVANMVHIQPAAIGRAGTTKSTMLFKIIAFLAAAIPLILFVRSVFFRRPTRFGEGLKEFRKQADIAVWIFLGLIGCAVIVTVAKLIWTWWTGGTP
jgi:hypothetical protein